MHPEEYREAGLDGKFSRQAVVSILLFAAVWEALSYLAPALGIPAFAIPSLARIGRSLLTITPIDVLVTLARVIGALIASFVLGVALAVLMYRSQRLESYLRPMIRLFMAVPVVSWILFAVLWFRGVEFRIAFVLIAVCGPVFLIDAFDAWARERGAAVEALGTSRPPAMAFYERLGFVTRPTMYYWRRATPNAPPSTIVGTRESDSVGCAM